MSAAGTPWSSDRYSATSGEWTGAPVSGRAYLSQLPRIPSEWGSAVTAFENGSIVSEIFDSDLRSMLIACKRQEIAGFAEQVTDFEFSAYLEIV